MQKSLTDSQKSNEITNVASATAKSQLSAQDIENIAVLAALKVDPINAEAFATSINGILELMSQLSDVNTDGVEPLRNPFEVSQPLRDDIALDLQQRDHYQSIAPLIQDGLYLVPRVLE